MLKRKETMPEISGYRLLLLNKEPKDITFINSIRPIMIRNLIIKMIFETTILSKLKAWLLDEKIINKVQNGFVPKNLLEIS